ncbi:MAG: HlyD family efflux transporter periplasmic adaptor subunit [Desulfobacteraceae bacterium]|nr:HlyD family efflux transporter periplasmic adaptor subunit [Desulfobacteraceae bacterium]
MKKILIITGFAVLLLISVPVFFSHPVKRLSGNTLTDIAIKREFSVTVKSVGELDAVRATFISSELQGDKGKIIWLAEDGTRVDKGDVLVRFDPSEFEEKVRQLSNKVKELEARVAANEQVLEWEKTQVKREILTAEFDLKVAKLDLKKLEKGEGPLELTRIQETTEQAKLKFEKYKGYVADLERIREQGHIKDDELAEVRKKLEESEREFKTARKKYLYYRDYVLPTNIEKLKAGAAKAKVNLEQKKKGGGYKIGKAIANLQLASQELESTETLLQDAESDLDKTVIRASIPGMAVLREAFHKGEKRKPRIGDQVLRNQPIIYLPDISRMMVKTKIREIDLHKVSPGKAVLVRVDAYPDAALNGRVEAIGVLAQSERFSKGKEKYFTVDILVLDEDNRMRPGMTARLEILCSEFEGLTIPVQAVFHENGKSCCFIENENGFEKREIVVGIRNEDFVHVVSGLKKEDQVALSIPEKMELDTIN